MHVSVGRYPSQPPVFWSADLISVTFTDVFKFLQTEILDDDKRMVSAVDYYFIQEDGSRFKVS